MKTKRFIAIGGLIGILLGIIVSFIVPDLLLFGVQYNSLSNYRLGLPVYTPKGGSILNSLMVIPLLFGLVGGFLGYIANLLIRKKQIQQ